MEEGNKLEKLERKVEDLERKLQEVTDKKSLLEQVKDVFADFAGKIRILSGNIQSGNFKSGEAGWSLNGNGDLEANDGTFRGRLEAEEGYFNGDIEGATFIGTNFEGINVDASNITGTDIDGGTITGTDVSAVNLSGSTITGGDISGTNIDGVDITGSTITGGEIRTSDGDDRVEMNEEDNTLTVYKDGYKRIAMGEGTLTFLTPTGIGAGEVVGLGTQNLAFNTSGVADYIMTPSYLYSTNEQDLGGVGDRFGTIYLVNSPDVSSSIKLKENIKDIEYGLSDVVKMKPVIFNKKNKKEKELGFIAEDLEKITPEISSGESYKPTEIIPILVKAIQELNNKLK